jgi:signal transduction histidine kinase
MPAMPFVRSDRAGRIVGAGLGALAGGPWRPALAAGGDAVAPGSPGLVIPLLLILLLAAAVVLLARQVLQLQRARQQEREAARAGLALAGGLLWQTDAEHRLVAWGAAGEASQAHCALFEPGPCLDALRPSLQAAHAFSGLLLQAEHPVEGSRGWRLAGVPVHDAEGRFAGFRGKAEPTDAAERTALDARLVTPLLAAEPGAALLLLDASPGWQVHAANAAARTLFPQLAAGAALPPVLAHLADEDSPAVREGWAAVPLALEGRRARLIRQEQPRTPPAHAEGSEGSEGENFSFTLSHDLRAPIRVVEGFTRIVKEDYGRQLDRVGNDHLDRVLGAAARMNLMIDALLTLARLSQQPLARQRVNLTQLAGYVVDDLRRGAPERECQFTIETGLSAWGDPTLLRLVLENLLGNAWKYTAKVSPAVISLREVPHGAGRAFVVGDNGAGFDMASADRLFGLFQRLHSASDFPGHGVGLASVRRIVRRHGGEVWAESEPGKGAAFYFTLNG